MKSERRKFLTKRYLLWGGGTLLILLLLAAALRPRPVAVEVAAAERGLLRVTVDEEGETRVRERFLVSAPMPGRLLRIELEPGDEVRAGETVLATFRPAEPTLLDARSRAEARGRVRAAEAELGRARAEHERAEAELRYAEAELQRYARLAEQRIVSGEELERVETELETRRKAARAAEFAVANARQSLAVARAGLVEAGQDNPGDRRGPIEIRSPVDGRVLRRLRESEAVVAAGDPLLEVGDPRDLEIVSDLLSSDAVKVAPGQPVIVEQWGGDRPLAGVVRRVEPYGFTKISALGVEEQRVNVVVDFTEPFEERRALGDGYRVEVRIVVWEGEDVLRVPTSSLFRHGEGWAVWVVEAGRARLRGVEIGARNGLAAEVRAGLDTAERVIVHPSDAIEDGARVAARD